MYSEKRSPRRWTGRSTDISEALKTYIGIPTYIKVILGDDDIVFVVLSCEIFVVVVCMLEDIGAGGPHRTSTGPIAIVRHQWGILLIIQGNYLEIHGKP